MQVLRGRGRHSPVQDAPFRAGYELVRTCVAIPCLQYTFEFDAVPQLHTHVLRFPNDITCSLSSRLRVWAFNGADDGDERTLTMDDPDLLVGIGSGLNPIYFVFMHRHMISAS